MVTESAAAVLAAEQRRREATVDSLLQMARVRGAIHLDETNTLRTWVLDEPVVGAQALALLMLNHHNEQETR